MKSMRLLQWNIQWCRGMDGVVDPERIARVAREQFDPDVCCFQEVAVNFPALAGSTGEDQVQRLGAAFPGYAAHYGWGVDVPDENGARRRFGNLVLSRLPVRQVLRHLLPWPAHDSVPSMPRVALEAVIEAPWGTVRVTTTHLEYYSDIQRAAQVARLCEIDAEASAQARARSSNRYDSGPFHPFARPASSILTGDLNMRPDDLLMMQMRQTWRDAWQLAQPGQPQPPTFGVFDPEFGSKPYYCDFVLVSEDLAPRVTEVRVDSDCEASDHQPVIAEFRA
jgi:endonuclease/exonuclease/phosphatase family metal-dependent hydrolase